MFYSASMRFAFGDEQEELRRSVRRALDAHGGITAARKVLGGELGHDGALWSVLAKDLGLAGLIVPEEHGGAGLGWTEVAAVLEELGRTLAPVPFFSTVCLGTNALVACNAHAYLPAIASGDRTAALAVAAEVEAHPAAAGGARLRGRARFVVDGDTADIIVVAARDGLYRSEEHSLNSSHLVISYAVF